MVRSPVQYRALHYALNTVSTVTPGLDPGVHQLLKNFFTVMDCRVKPGNDSRAGA